MRESKGHVIYRIKKEFQKKENRMGYKMSEKELKNIEKRLKDTLNFYFAQNPIRELDYRDKVYMNLAKAVYPMVKENIYFEDDLFFSALSWYIKKYESLPEKVDVLEVENLIKYVKDIFNINKQTHYFIVPLQGSSLQEDFSFGFFHFLKEDTENILVQKIATISHIDEEEISSFLYHIKKAYSKDFMESNLLVIETENQTENIHQSAYRLAQNAIDIMLLLDAGIEHDIDDISWLAHYYEGWIDKNCHVAILSKEDWRCGHSYRSDAHLQCNINLDFLKEKDFQQKFLKLYSLFGLKSKNKLIYKFYNSFILWSKARTQQDDSLALLLYLIAIESLITEGKNEKRLRLSAIVPKLIKCEGITQRELSQKLSDMYKRRNDFVHTGEEIKFDVDNEELRLLENVVAKLILRIIDIDKELNIKVQNEWKAWEKYVDCIFDNIIFGMDVSKK